MERGIRHVILLCIWPFKKDKKWNSTKTSKSMHWQHTNHKYERVIGLLQLNYTLPNRIITKWLNIIKFNKITCYHILYGTTTLNENKKGSKLINMDCMFQTLSNDTIVLIQEKPVNVVQHPLNSLPIYTNMLTILCPYTIRMFKYSQSCYAE